MPAKRKRHRPDRGGVRPGEGTGRRPTTYELPQPDYAGLLGMLGTDGKVVELIRAETGKEVPLSSITGWRLRNSVPTVWVPTILKLGLDAGILDSPDDVVKPKTAV